MIYYNEMENYYCLLGQGFDLYAFSLYELINQAKEIYNINLLTQLN